MSKRACFSAAAGVFLAIVTCSASATEKTFHAPLSEGKELIGSPAPAWPRLQWIHSPPIKLTDLRGQVILLRFWTDTCPFCRATAPVLKEFHDRYGPRGLRVIGFYHPKPPREVRAEYVEKVAADLGFTFPIALDPHWHALQRYWLDDTSRAWTSVSFLIDKQGSIRYIHPGGEYHPGGGPEHQSCNAAYVDIKRRMEKLLAEPYSREKSLTPQNVIGCSWSRSPLSTWLQFPGHDEAGTGSGGAGISFSLAPRGLGS